MNYLAHFYFCAAKNKRVQQGLVVGALLGDFIKGPLTETSLPLDSAIREKFDTDTIFAGIQLHRDIDAYFDSLANQMLFADSTPDHPFRQLSTVQSRRYLPIAIDLYFDYAMSHRWASQENLSLAGFNEQVLDTLNQHSALLPDNAKRLVSRMKQFDLLIRYNDENLLRDICASIAKRISRKNTLLETFDEIGLHKSHLMQFYDDAYPKLQQFSNSWQQDKQL